MGRIKKIYYQSKKLTSFIIKDIKDFFIFLLWVSSTPLSAKVLISSLEEIVSPSTVRENLRKLYKRGFISKIKKRKRLSLFFLKKTFSEYAFLPREVILRKRLSKKWDGLWWIVIYDIPEKIKGKRDKFRQLLKSLGFGKVKESCWVSPYDFSSEIYNFCKKINILKYICMYKGEFFTGENVVFLVEKVWRLNQLSNQYELLIGQCDKLLEKIGIKGKIENEDKLEFFEIYLKFKQYLKEDPYLPEKFLKNWLRDKLEKKVKKLSKSILAQFKNATEIYAPA